MSEDVLKKIYGERYKYFFLRQELDFIECLKPSPLLALRGKKDRKKFDLLICVEPIVKNECEKHTDFSFDLQPPIAYKACVSCGKKATIFKIKKRICRSWSCLKCYLEKRSANDQRQGTRAL